MIRIKSEKAHIFHILSLKFQSFSFFILPEIFIFTYNFFQRISQCLHNSETNVIWEEDN